MDQAGIHKESASGKKRRLHALGHAPIRTGGKQKNVLAISTRPRVYEYRGGREASGLFGGGVKGFWEVDRTRDCRQRIWRLMLLGSKKKRGVWKEKEKISQAARTTL